MTRSWGVVLCAVVGCSSSSSSGSSAINDAGGDAVVLATDGGSERDPKLAGCAVDPGAPAFATFGASDPVGGADKFTLERALAGYPATSGKLSAAIVTEKGTILCRLSETEAPITVANFVGLARGTRPFKDNGGTWKTGRFYDGLTWHRVIPDFVIQGGDPAGDGTGGPGYSLPQENHAPEVTGVLAMAASAEPSGSQFYVVVGKGPADDYNVFGACEVDVAVAIAAVDRDAKDRPKIPVHMKSIQIARCP